MGFCTDPRYHLMDSNVCTDHSSIVMHMWWKKTGSLLNLIKSWQILSMAGTVSSVRDCSVGQDAWWEGEGGRINTIGQISENGRADEGPSLRGFGANSSPSVTSLLFLPTVPWEP